MENALDTQARGPKTGYVPIQRLNRTEYAASVKALTGVDVDEKEILPAAVCQAAGERTAGAFVPQQRLYLAPEPQGQGAPRGIDTVRGGSDWVCFVATGLSSRGSCCS